MRRAGTLAAMLIAACAVTGCTPEPQPSPTGFADADAAYAAAEQTYRAYVDAVNHVDLSDPATFEDVYTWTTGDAFAGERKSLTEMHAKGWTIGGTAMIVSMTPDPAATNLLAGIATINACTDISQITVTEPGGSSVVSPDRPTVQSIVVEVTQRNGAPTEWLISRLSGGAHPC